MQTSWLLIAAAALASTGSTVNAINAVFAASTSQCSSVTTCYEGGASSTPCTVSTGGCPPCITFADDGCYVKVSGSCPFGVDCSSVWGSSSTTTSSGSTTSSTSTSSTTGTTSSGSTTSGTSTTASSTTSDSDTTGTAGTSSNSSTGTAGTAGTSSGSSISSASGSSGTSAGDSTSSGSDMSVVFAIIGAAIGVIAVAVIFLTLVRRSKAAHEDEDDDMVNTPPAFAKNPVVQAPHSTPGATTYASYAGMNRPAGMGSGTAGEIGLDMSKSGGVSMNAVSYYNQQPRHNLAAPSPRVAGRAIPSQPVGMNQPMGMGRQFGSNPNFAALGGVGVTSGLGASGVGMTSQAPPAVVQHIPMGGVAPSPHSRRESYEF
ncbi:hypothetical protein PF010_g23733 [Phytophthora fragariae]|uniref:Carbohydrate-binding protein n=1 Tax=Phytophthora fragariae TaxID=53985 RepID=A0A6G0NKN7_9STRA|nr:hypothetical protein PF010_g23733 [Phytophthora fragariae]KAE9212267.1 hypothetical protein PF004_g15680 [Phytophthora fragariae]